MSAAGAGVYSYILDPESTRAVSPAVYKDTLYFVLVPPSPGGPEGGSGVSFSFKRRGFGPDSGGGGSNFTFDVYFDLKYSWVRFVMVFRPMSDQT
jgi:hypothetical protein